MNFKLSGAVTPGSPQSTFDLREGCALLVRHVSHSTLSLSESPILARNLGSDSFVTHSHQMHYEVVLGVSRDVQCDMWRAVLGWTEAQDELGQYVKQEESKLHPLSVSPECLLCPWTVW